MDPRERFSDPGESLRLAVQGALAGVQTAIPGIVQSFNATQCTAVVQPAIQAIVTGPTGSAVAVNLPLLLDCPVAFPGGGGCTLTFPLAAGDEVLVIFGSRCIDAWWQSGGVQPQAEFRMHDLSDGFVIPRVRSLPHGITISTARAQLRSDDGLAYVELDPAGHVVNIVAPGGVTITAPTVHITGNVQVDQTLTSTIDVVGGGKSLKTHVHSGVQSGTSNTGAPV
ncbi:MAG: hypothetical protein KGH75_02480 [Rhodospirillales bacterium]|nr:hypothetical protein [Rhodospirillales bacterium]